MNEGAALFLRSLDEFVRVHESVQAPLSEEIKEQETKNWFEPKMSTFKDFLFFFIEIMISHDKVECYKILSLVEFMTLFQM